MHRNPILRHCCITIFCLNNLSLCVCEAEADSLYKETVPLQSAHAHNDYWHERPLLDALDHGFNSVECDVFLKEGRLLVGHEVDELESGRTLETLYLEPLSKRVAANNGYVYSKPCRFFLLVDIKSDRQSAYSQLRELLMKYADMLTTWDEDSINPGAITVVITSAEPRVRLVDEGKRYAGIDGRLVDLMSEAPSCEIPMISDRWPSHFRWTGDGPFPADEKAWLRKIVLTSHKKKRVVRMWGTPEKEVVWEELLEAGVDLINTDELARLEEFLRSKRETETSGVTEEASQKSLRPSS